MQLMKKNHIQKRLEDHTYLICKERPLSYITESFQKVVLNIETANIDQNVKVIQVTSTQPDEGKSTLIANVGYLIGKQNKKILLVDFDLRRPKLHKIFKKANQNGFIDYIIGKCELEDIIHTSPTSNTDFILSGTKTQLISNVLTSNKLFKMIQTLKNNYDYILLDSPPVLSVSDALYISKLSDAVIYVIAQDRAKKNDIKEGIELLKQQKAKILGTVLTQKNQQTSDYNKNYYKGYYTTER